MEMRRRRRRRAKIWTMVVVHRPVRVLLVPPLEPRGSTVETNQMQARRPRLQRDQSLFASMVQSATRKADSTGSSLSTLGSVKLSKLSEYSLTSITVIWSTGCSELPHPKM